MIRTRIIRRRRLLRERGAPGRRWVKVKPDAEADRRQAGAYTDDHCHFLEADGWPCENPVAERYDAFCADHRLAREADMFWWTVDGQVKRDADMTERDSELLQGAQALVALLVPQRWGQEP